MNYDLGAIVALSVLLLAICGVLFAAVYAVCGRPKTPSGKKRKRQVTSGFRLAGGILLGFVLIGALIVGIGVGFCGQKLGPAPLSFSSRPLALALVGISLTSLFVTVQRWAKYLGGWIGYGALNGLIMASSGHLLNNPAIPVRRSLALTMTGIVIVSALACLRFTEGYQLNVVDKIAVVGWIVCFAVVANVEKYGVPGLTLAGSVLVFAWMYHHFRGRRPRRALSSRN